MTKSLKSEDNNCVQQSIRNISKFVANSSVSIMTPLKFSFSILMALGLFAAMVICETIPTQNMSNKEREALRYLFLLLQKIKKSGYSNKNEAMLAFSYKFVTTNKATGTPNSFTIKQLIEMFCNYCRDKIVVLGI